MRRRPAHAKLNLGLRVLGRRDDGFHEVDTTLVQLDLHDTLEFAPAPRAGDGLERIPTGDAWLDAMPMPVDEHNLVLRALAAYRRAAAAPVGGAAVGQPPAMLVRLRKRIPVAAGLGGGSSDAAAVLLELAERWPAGIDLATLAAELGSDVPFFVSRAPSARATGRGERLAPRAVADFVAVLVHPGVGVTATEAYRWWRPSASAAPSAAPSAWRDLDLANDLEAGVAARRREVAAALAELRSATAAPVAMSGSGATCYALFEEGRADEAEALVRAGRLRRPGWWWSLARPAPITPPAG